MLGRPIQTSVSSGRDLLPSWALALSPRVHSTRLLQISQGVPATIEVAIGREAGLVTAVVGNALHLNADDLRRVVAGVWESVLEMLHDSGFVHPVRMWSFIPGIHEQLSDDIDRYRLFNMGRFDAFTRWFAGAATFRSVLPAATAVGHFGEELVVCALGLCTAGLAIENPRQVPASAYSRSHGPLPPCFARAMVAMLPDGARLLVSGTASIRGEDSVYHGSLHDQLEETFLNLACLMRSVPGPERFDLRGVETARVYFPRLKDHASLEREVVRRLPASAAIEFFPAWICRQELLVEIEATVAPC